MVELNAGVIEENLKQIFVLFLLFWRNFIISEANYKFKKSQKKKKKSKKSEQITSLNKDHWSGMKSGNG